MTKKKKNKKKVLPFEHLHHEETAVFGPSLVSNRVPYKYTLSFVNKKTNMKGQDDESTNERTCL